MAAGMIARSCCLVLVASCLGACHLIFPFGHGSPSEDAAPLDQSFDRPDDHSLPDSDFSPPALQCLSPVQLTSGEEMIESALTADGKTLVGQQRGSPWGFFCLDRKAPTSHDFETIWYPCLSGFSGYFDLNYYVRAGKTCLLTSRRLKAIGYNRRIYKCTGSPPTQCAELGPITPTLAAAEDIDGPDIRQTLRPDGVEEIFASYQNATESNLFLLQGKDVDGPLTRQALPELNSSLREDDPSIHPDGSLIVFTSARGGDEDLYYAVRKPDSSPPQFYPPQEIPKVNSAEQENGPELALTSMGGVEKLELFFSRIIPAGTYQIFYTTCELK